ncbi:MAG: hypothetical protein JNL75_06595 [Chitinophagales bacterium]|nr:hypothetical protein [Chitinophagales bacterium]
MKSEISIHRDAVRDCAEQGIATTISNGEKIIDKINDSQKETHGTGTTHIHYDKDGNAVSSRLSTHGNGDTIRTYDKK